MTWSQEDANELRRKLALADVALVKAELVFETRRERLKLYIGDLQDALSERTAWIGQLLQAVGKFRHEHITRRFGGKTRGRDCGCEQCLFAAPIFHQAARENWTWHWEPRER